MRNWYSVGRFVSSSVATTGGGFVVTVIVTDADAVAPSASVTVTVAV